MPVREPPNACAGVEYKQMSEILRQLANTQQIMVKQKWATGSRHKPQGGTQQTCPHARSSESAHTSGHARHGQSGTARPCGKSAKTCTRSTDQTCTPATACSARPPPKWHVQVLAAPGILKTSKLGFRMWSTERPHATCHPNKKIQEPHVSFSQWGAVRAPIDTWRFFSVPVTHAMSDGGTYEPVITACRPRAARDRPRGICQTQIPLKLSEPSGAADTSLHARPAWCHTKCGMSGNPEPHKPCSQLALVVYGQHALQHGCLAPDLLGAMRVVACQPCTAPHTPPSLPGLASFCHSFITARYSAARSTQGQNTNGLKQLVIHHRVSSKLNALNPINKPGVREGNKQCVGRRSHLGRAG